MIASTAGAAVTGPWGFLVPLQSGFAVTDTGMTFERMFATYTPDGTQLSEVPVLLTGPFGEQAAHALKDLEAPVERGARRLRIC